MVQQIVVLCDVCYDEDKTEQGSGHFVTIDGGAMRHLELCDKHYATLVEPLADVAERLGQVVKDVKTTKRKPSPPAGATANRPTTEPCLVCGTVVASSPALTKHYQDRHGLNGLSGAYGLTCPLCAHVSASGVSASAHVGREHPEVGSTGMPEAFRYAAEHGDPHDVVAKRLAELGLDGMPPRKGAEA